MNIRASVKPIGSSNVAFITSALVCVLFAPAISQSAWDWVEINDPAELRAIYSNTTLKGTVDFGVQTGSTRGGTHPFVSHNSADGRGIIIFYGQETPRTWEVKGNDQVCIKDARGNACYVYWRHRDKKNQIRAKNIGQGFTWEGTVEDGIPKF